MASSPGDVIYGMLANSGLGGQAFQDGLNAALAPQRSQLLRQQVAGGQMQLQAAQQAQQQDQAYQQAISDWTANGAKPDQLLQIAAQFPRQAENAIGIYKQQDSAAKDADRTYWGEVLSASSGGSTELVKQKLLARRDAELKAGRDASDYQHALDTIDADPTQGNAVAKALSTGHLFALDPGNFKALYGDGSGNAEGKVVGSSIGHYEGNKFVVDYKDDKQQNITVKNADGSESIVQVGGGGAGTPSAPSNAKRVMGWTPRFSNGGDNPDAAVDGKIAMVAKAAGIDPDQPLTREQVMALPIHLGEGGAGSLADRNNNPGNIRNPDGSYRKYPNKQAGTQASAALLSRFYDRGQRTIRDIIDGRPVGGAAQPSSGPKVLFTSQSGGKPQYQVLSPGEAQQLGLNPRVRYQRSPTGEVTAIGGQTKDQLKPIPQAAVKAIIDNRDSIRQIDAAIAAIKNRPESIGPGTGVLGDYFTQFHDPSGADTRAAIGKVGGQIIHDVSGAAVTASEEPRFKPYVPLVTDRPQVALTKLNRLKALIQGKQSDFKDAYSEDQGYRAWEPDGGAPQRSVSSAPSQPPAGSKPIGRYQGKIVYLTPDGRKWVP